MILCIGVLRAFFRAERGIYGLIGVFKMSG